jgi:glutamyl-Q tRNA(Asp) synthetase
LASFLDARHHQGRWLLRMDDLDTPRNKPGAVQAILDCLDESNVNKNKKMIAYRTKFRNKKINIKKMRQKKYL